MENSKLKKILDLHKKWLLDEADGKRANLCEADLCRANLCEADLRKANLSRANLCGADLYGADLCEADLCRANLYGADLRKADLYGADLCEADLCRADLTGANLTGAKISKKLMDKYYPLACPETGEFVAYKKVNGYIIRLQVLEDAKRSSAFGRKCRCSKAKCLAIENLDGTESELTRIASDRDNKFIYEVGQVVSVDNFDDERTHECSTGIHFFITRQEAVDYI